MQHLRPLAATLAALTIAAGCGGSTSAGTSSTATPSTPTTAEPAASTDATSTGGATSTPDTSPGTTTTDSADAAPKRTVADNEIFRRVENSAGGYTLRLPGWWRLRQDGTDMRAARLDSYVVVKVKTTPKATTLDALRKSFAKMAAKGSIDIVREPWRGTHQYTHEPAYKSLYRVTIPKAVTTGKEMTLLVVRFDFVKGRTRATLIAASPKGIDNTDAFDLVGRSFRWAK
jgi:hypothetical protein